VVVDLAFTLIRWYNTGEPGKMDKHMEHRDMGHRMKLKYPWFKGREWKT
jgi:hypothetical protein